MSLDIQSFFISFTNINRLWLIKILNDSCLGSKSPSHYFPVLGNLLAVLLIKFPTTNQILTEFCFISIIRNFEYIINDDSYHSILFWSVSTLFLAVGHLQGWKDIEGRRNWELWICWLEEMYIKQGNQNVSWKLLWNGLW